MGREVEVELASAEDETAWNDAAATSSGRPGRPTGRWTAASEGRKRMDANHFRIWEELLWARDQRFEAFDFAGLPSDPKSGIHRFKMQFWGQVKRVDWYVKQLGITKLARTRRRPRPVSGRGSEKRCRP